MIYEITTVLGNTLYVTRASTYVSAQKVIDMQPRSTISRIWVIGTNCCVGKVKK